MNRMALVVHHLHAVCDPYHADGREQPGAKQERSEIPRKQDPKKKQDAGGTRGAKQEGVSRVAARSGAVIAVRAFLQFASYRTLMSIVDNDNLGVFMDLLNRRTSVFEAYKARLWQSSVRAMSRELLRIAVTVEKSGLPCRIVAAYSIGGAVIRPSFRISCRRGLRSGEGWTG